MRALRTILCAAMLGLLILFGVAPRVSASPSSPAAVTAGPVFAASVSWYGFVKYWKSFVKNSNQVVVIVALVAALALFIITRGKWLR